MTAMLMQVVHVGYSKLVVLLLLLLLWSMLWQVVLKVGSRSGLFS